MNYNQHISDIFDINTDKYEIIKNDDNIIVIKFIKFFDKNQKIKTNMNLLNHYGYILFKTKYNYFYFDNKIIYNNLIINTFQDIIPDKYINITYKPKSNDLNNSDKSDKLDNSDNSYYDQKAKLEMYLFKMKIKINYNIHIRLNEKNLINTEDKYIVFIKYMEIDKKFDKKFITLNIDNYSIIYKLCNYQKNIYNMYLYKIKNMNTYDELTIDIDYDKCENIFLNLLKFNDLIYKFLPNNFIVHDKNYEYLGNLIYHIIREKYLVSNTKSYGLYESILV
jgi:hypothetical protein